MNNLEIFECVNGTTGEVREAVWLSDLQEQQDKKKVQSIQGMQIRKKKEGLQALIDAECGSFYFHQYKNLLEEVAGDTALAFRFLYLCTYADYEGVLMYGCKKWGKYHTAMQEKDFVEVFGLSRNRALDVRTALYETGLLVRDAETGLLLVNKKYCRRGKSNWEDAKKSVRVFDKGIQTLYSNTRPTEHKKVGVLFALLPFLHKQYNLLCYNIEEVDTAKAKAMSMQDICRVVGYSVSKAKRLQRDLLSLEIDGQPVLMISTKKDGDFYYINPLICYAGTEIEELDALIQMFRAKK